MKRERESEVRGGLLTRREVLAQTARGAVVLSAGPLLGQAQRLLAEEAPAASPRTRESFDFGWRFFRGDASGAEQPEFADGAWREVDLPHDWSIEGPFAQDAPAGGPGGYLPCGVGWYRKRFHAAEALRDKMVTLEFDGVYQNSEVWVNGHALGLRPYGYAPFAYEVTPHLRLGGENVVAVRVDNSQQPNCRWYSGSGIYRHTWLLATEPVRVAYWGTFVLFPHVAKSAATVEVRTRVANGGQRHAACELTTAILDPQGQTVASQTASQGVASGDAFTFVQQLTVPTPSLWSPETPAMYTVRNTVREAGQVVDVYDTTVGIREAVFDAERGFLLNGEHVKLNGVCVHPGAGSVGAAVPEGVWERRLDLLRAMGCNAIRTSHNPFAAEFLNLCDRKGFLVMAEAFDEWRIAKGQVKYGYHLYFDEWHERDASAMLHRDRNHPSIVLWSAGNEVPDQSAEDGAQTLRGLLKIFHAEDPTRPVTVACDRIASEPPSNTVRPEFLALLDIVGYNYVDRWRERADLYYSIDHAAFPNRRVIGTESGAMGGIRGDYRYLFPSEASPMERRFLMPTNRALDVEALWEFVRTHDYVAGDFMWTGIDYLGEAFWPFKGAPAGTMDTCGFPKDGYFFYQSQWTEKPMIHLFPHWNWKGREGQVIPVSCFTNCDTVELFVNGKSLGEKGYEFPRLGMEGTYGNYPPRARALRTTNDLHLSWDVPYEAGTLKAVGTKNGQPACTAEVRTTGGAAMLGLALDRTTLRANRRDVVHVTVEVQDADGRVVPDADHAIAFTVEGNGKLIGVDNGDPASHEDYKGSTRKAFHGMCLGIVQATGSAGPIRVTVSSPGLQAAKATLTTTV